jgi:hypothetical protein
MTILEFFRGIKDWFWDIPHQPVWVLWMAILLFLILVLYSSRG